MEPHNKVTKKDEKNQVTNRNKQTDVLVQQATQQRKPNQ